LQSGSELGDAELSVPGAAAPYDPPALLLGGAVGLGAELPASALDVGRRLSTGPSMALRDTPSLRSKQLPMALASFSAGLICPVCALAGMVAPSSVANRTMCALFVTTTLHSRPDQLCQAPACPAGFYQAQWPAACSG
jgi:hypothetical protein